MLARRFAWRTHARMWQFSSLIIFGSRARIMSSACRTTTTHSQLPLRYFRESEMMKRHLTVLGLCAAAVLAGCSKQPAPMTATQSSEPPATSAPEPESNSAANSGNVMRARLNASGVAAEYSAHFDGKNLVRIDEHRQPQGSSAVDGEYTFQGARLLRYHGAKISQPAVMDLQFDMQGALQSGRVADVTAEDIDAIRNRAQLLRSHALAQRGAREHSNY
jgi:hypothetical protein